jgi:citrate lyase subunit beta/citryl-CoA lyase
MDQQAHTRGLDSGADVLVADLEQFTAPADRPQARLRIVELLAQCRERHVVGAVRVNQLDADGLDDLQAIMAGAPDAILLPHTETPQHMVDLDAALLAHERRLGLPLGSTELIPTLESARAIVHTYAILTATDRISACLLAVEDLSEDLQLERSPEGLELHAVRSRFLVECVAAGRVAIDSPFNYRDPFALETDLKWARRMGFKSKCTVFAQQVAAIHRAFTPSDDDYRQAQGLIERYAQQQQEIDPGGMLIDVPDAHTARRLCARHQQFQLYAERILAQSRPARDE